MRQIKVRAWDGKEFLPLAREVAFIDNEGVLRSRVEGIIFNLFANFVDKHGKEVYDGDIVELLFLHPVHGPYKKRAQVVYSSFRWWFQMRESGFVGADWVESSWQERSEVIGNIYENPELLEVNEPVEGN